MIKNDRKKKIRAKRTKTDNPVSLSESEKNRKYDKLSSRKSNLISKQIPPISSFELLRHSRFNFEKSLREKFHGKKAITLLKSELNVDDNETLLEELSTLSRSSTDSSSSGYSESLSIKTFPNKDMNAGSASTGEGSEKMAGSSKTPTKRPKRPSMKIANSNISTTTNLGKITKANINKQSFYIFKLPFGAKVEMKDGHLVLIDYKKMDRKKIRSIQSFCCYNSILPILALSIFTIWHSVFYLHLTDLDRQTIEFWFTDLEAVKKSNSVISIMSSNYTSILTPRMVDHFDTWIIMLVCVTFLIFAMGMIAFCYHNHCVMMFYCYTIIPLLIILVLFLVVSIIAGFILWSRLNKGSSMNFLREHYEEYPWLQLYMHHTHQWFRCCDWIIQNDDGHHYQNYATTVSSPSNMVPVSCCHEIISYDHTEQSLRAFLNAISSKWCPSESINPLFRRRCAKHPAIITMILLLIITQIVLIIDIIRLCMISIIF